MSSSSRVVMVSEGGGPMYRTGTSQGRETKGTPREAALRHRPPNVRDRILTATVDSVYGHSKAHLWPDGFDGICGNG